MSWVDQGLSERRASFGTWSVLPGSLTVEILGGAEFDQVIIDPQHGVLVAGGRYGAARVELPRPGNGPAQPR
jgi:hypothetical protein